MIWTTHSTMLATIDWPFLAVAAVFAAIILTWPPFKRLARACNLAWAQDGDAARSLELAMRLRQSWLPLAFLERWFNRGQIEGLIALRHNSLGNLDDAISWAERGLRIARKPQIRGLLHTLAAVSHAERNDREGFERHLAALRQIFARHPALTLSPTRVAAAGERELGAPNRAEAILREAIGQSPASPSPELFHETLWTLLVLGRFEDVLCLTASIVNDAAAASPEAPAARPATAQSGVGNEQVLHAHRRFIEFYGLLAAIQAAQHAERWDIYAAYLGGLQQMPNPPAHVRVQQLGRRAVLAAHLADADEATACVEAMDALIAQYPRDARLKDARSELTARAYQFLGRHDRALAELAAESTVPLSPLARSERAALVAKSFEAIGLADMAETKRAEAMALAPQAYWNRPSDTPPPAADTADELVRTWLSAGPQVAAEGAMAAAGIGPVPPVASGTAAAAWVLAVLAMVPVVGMLAAIALVPISIILLAKRRPLAHDRRVGVAGLAFACVSFACGITAVFGVVQWASHQAYSSEEIYRTAPTTTRAPTTRTSATQATEEEEAPMTSEADEEADEELAENVQAPVRHEPVRHRTDGASRRRMSWPQTVMIFAVLIVSVMLHEIGHAVAAYWGGDPTARDLGRFSLNPIRHIDLFGSIILPVLLVAVQSESIIGWAKPVLVRFDRLRHPRRGQLGVTLAGVSLNLLIALAATNLLAVLGLTIRYLYPHAFVFRMVIPMMPATVVNAAGAGAWETAIDVCKMAIVINTLLAGFNLLPIPPLDGFGVIRALAPARLAGVFAKAAGAGTLVLLVLIATNALGYLLGPAIHATIYLCGYVTIVTGWL